MLKAGLDYCVVTIPHGQFSQPGSKTDLVKALAIFSERLWIKEFIHFVFSTEKFIKNIKITCSTFDKQYQFGDEDQGEDNNEQWPGLS